MKNVISSILTILCFAIVGLGFLIIIGSIIVAMGWLVTLAVTLFAGGGPSAAVYSQSWPVLIIASVAGLVGILFVFIGYFLLYIGSLIVSKSSFSSSLSSFSSSTLSSLFSLPGLPSGLEDIFKGLDPMNILVNLSYLFFLPDELRQKLPPNILSLLECFKKCLCKHICGSEPSKPSPGKNFEDIIDVLVDTGNVLLDDLKAQYEETKKKIEELKNKLDELKNHFPHTSYEEWKPLAEELLYLQNKLKELGKRIIELGGSI